MLKLWLQRFADGEGGAAPAAEGNAAGGEPSAQAMPEIQLKGPKPKENPLAGMQYGIQNNNQQQRQQQT